MFYIAEFENLIRTVNDGIEQLFPNHRLLIRFWQEKNADHPGKSSQLRFDDSRDSYDRCDYYNALGLAVFFMLKLRRAQFTHMGVDLGEWEGFQLTSHLGLTFLQPHGPLFAFELFQPLLIETLSSKSETIKSLALDSLQTLMYFTQTSEARNQIASLTKFTGDDKTVKEIFVNTFLALGEQTCYDQTLTSSDIRVVQNSKMKTLHCMLRLYTAKPRLLLLEATL
jgi:hypothetical protein